MKYRNSINQFPDPSNHGKYYYNYYKTNNFMGYQFIILYNSSLNN